MWAVFNYLTRSYWRKITDQYSRICCLCVTVPARISVKLRWFKINVLLSRICCFSWSPALYCLVATLWQKENSLRLLWRNGLGHEWCAQQTWGRILERNPDKILKSFPPCHSQSSLELCIEISISSHSRNLLQFLELVTVHCKGERKKTW